MILSNSQLEFISGILSDIGQIFFASMVVPLFFANIELLTIFIGLILASTSWGAGLILLKRIKI